MKRFALLGNPNSGKTTLFNNLTGSTAYVGNWPGVTVEQKSGSYKKLAEPISIIDLPGVYSLSPYTSEEVITRNYILDEKPDLVINIVDATNLERNLYLTTQLLEIGVPVVIALNMMDVVQKNKEKIDINALEAAIGVPVIEISALRENNIHDLMKIAYRECKHQRKGFTVLKGSSISHLIDDCEIAFEGINVDNPLYHSIKLIELDDVEVKNHQDLLKIVEGFRAQFHDDVFGTDFEAIIANERYKYITKNFSKYKTKSKPNNLAEKEKPEVRKDEKPAFWSKIATFLHIKGLGTKILRALDLKPDNKEFLTKSDRVDVWLTNKWFGIPIFLLILFFVFHLTFSENLFFLGGILESNNVAPSLADTPFSGLFWTESGINSPGVVLQSLIESVTGLISEAISGAMVSVEPWAQGLVVDGILAGLFGVLSFVPQILLLFLFFSILEDTGYMARIAFILDRLLRRFGLSGRAFMPMIMGFGCSVPAIINTRTLADENEKVATIRVIPFFSCGAKLPILTAISGALVTTFGIGNADFITYSMYLLGIIVAFITVILMRNTTMIGEVPPFIMELPTYHLPQFKSLMIHLWDKLKHYIKKAFTIIFASAIIIWVMLHFTWDWSFSADEATSNSIIAGLGQLVQPIFTPLGFGSQLVKFGWVFPVAIITGLIAKENVINTFGVLAAVIVSGFAPEEGMEGVDSVVQLIGATGVTAPALISFIAFNMLTIPCFAAVATAKAELPKNKYATTLLFWMLTSYVASTIIYTVGTWVWTLGIYIPLAILIGILVYLYSKNIIRLPKFKK